MPQAVCLHVKCALMYTDMKILVEKQALHDKHPKEAMNAGMQQKILSKHRAQALLTAFEHI